VNIVYNNVICVGGFHPHLGLLPSPGILQRNTFGGVIEDGFYCRVLEHIFHEFDGLIDAFMQGAEICPVRFQLEMEGFDHFFFLSY
jgi:hypothetical protein